MEFLSLESNRASKKPGVVITGGDFQGLAALRTFGEKNISTVLLDHELCIAKYSRYNRRYFKSPDPINEEEYTEFLVSLAKHEGLQGWIVIPNSDQTVRILSRHKELFEHFYRIPVPCWDVIQHVYVKEKTYKLAEQHGIPFPRTHYGQCLEEMLEHALSYPVIIKPSIRDNFYNKVKIKAFLINNRNELIETYRRVETIIDRSEILLQEYLTGGPKNLFSFCPFFKEGKSVAAITARRTRQHPMDFGHATTFAELVDIPQLQVMAEKFLSRIGYYGIAEVEFMMDPREGLFKLIEVNPRIWGWHALAIYAGVDLPFLLYKDMLGEAVEPPHEIQQVKWVRVLTDIPTVLREVAKGKMTVNEYINTMKGKKRDAVFSLKDPLPFIMELSLAPYLWYKRGF
jgi:D-aspartate ligase